MTIIYDNSITWEQFTALLEKKLEERTEPREIESPWIPYEDWIKLHEYREHHPLNNFGRFHESQANTK